MKLTVTGLNTTTIDFPTGVQVLFSYSTPVAAFVPGDGYVVTETKYSKTTTRHINRYLDGAGHATVLQSYINELAGAE